MAELSGPSLLRLITWLSPAFPVGAFSYSHGIERAVHDGSIHDRLSLTGWLADLIVHGSAWNDAVLLAASWRETEPGGRAEVAELAEALASSRERHMESMLQGEAFAAAATAWGLESTALPYPVAVGAAAGANGIPLEAVLAGFLHASSSNLVQAAIRLVPLGQSDGVATLAALEQVIVVTARCAAASTLDDLGSATFRSDIAAMRHETQYSRIFRS